jgi:hypothetical protein
MSTVDPKDPTNPVVGDKVKQLPEELRALKARINALELQLMRAPGSETLDALPAAAVRANRIQAYNSFGQPVMIVGVDSGSAADLALDLASNTLGQGGNLIGLNDGAGGADYETLEEYVATRRYGIRLQGVEDITGAVRRALVIGPGIDPTGVICFDGDVFGNYQPNPPSGPYGFHFTEDKSNINMTGVTNAYASHSITCKIVGSSNYDHFKAVQAWPSYESSGNMNDFDVIDTYPNHSGTGTITNLRHFRVKGNLGSGPITNEYGLYIDGINRGSVSNYAIFSISGAASHHYGAFGIGPGTSGVTAGLLVGGGQIRTIGAAGYFEASNSQSRFGPADQFIGATGATDTGISTFNDLHFAVASTSMVKMTAAGHLMPTADSSKTLGAAGTNRWSAVHSRRLVLSPTNNETPANNGEVVVQVTSNTSLTFKLKGSDGVVRSGSLTLA